MPRSTNTTIENTFVKGLITQATALNFPKDACIDQDNCIFSERSVVTRRLGFEFENNFLTNTQDRTEFAQNTYYWKNASGDGSINFVVQQNGTTLSFYNTTNGLSLSAGLSANTISLSSFIASGATTANLTQNECQYATGLGYLFVTHPYCDPFYVKYNSDGTFTSSLISFTVRDVFGIDEGVLVTNRPGSLTGNHQYNLLNQGWDTTKITSFVTAASVYPSNADVWWIYKDINDVYAPSTTLVNNNRGSTPAPQGFFRLNPWNTQRATVCNAQAGTTPSLSGTVDETSGSIRPAAVEFHAGRVWYASVNAQGYSSRIYFTCVVQKPKDFGYCGSVNDPTSETVFDFVASDGGIISIPQAGTIYKMISMGTNLIVFGANGIWAISGSRGVGFSANDYQVSNISYVRSIASTSYVVAEGSIFFWNQTDINVLTLGDNGYQVKSLTYDTIKDYYTDLSSQGKLFARGSYNPRTHVIQWLFRNATAGNLTQTYTFDTVINLNLLTQAFYTWSYDTSVVSIQGLVSIEGASSVISTQGITNNALVTVTDSLGNPLSSYGFASTAAQTTTKYLVSYPNSGSYKFTFAENFNPSFKDWSFQTGGKDYSSFFTTGYTVKTEGVRRFQSPYIYVFSDLAEVASQGMPSYTFNTIWNYGNINSSGRFTQKQTITQNIVHSETYFDVARRRLKVRGSGTSIQFTFASVSGKPFSVIGWSTYDTADQQP